jgi:hypothetical protein
MLDAKDLRIGNCLNKKLKSGNGRTLTDKIGCQDIVRIYENTGSINYEPIPLTEEWLFRFGFEVKSASVTHNYSYNIGFFVLTNGLRNNISYDGYEIVYVHQLQNLFYSLTNTELKLKDEK